MQELKTLESFQEELSNLERALVNNERKRQRLEQKEASPRGAADGLSVTERLTQLDQTVDYLSLAKDVSEWASATSAQKQQRPSSDLANEVDQCLSLGNLLCRHSPASTDSTSSSPLYGKFYASLWEEEYQPLHRYVHARVLALFRQSLRSSGYPSVEACQELLNQCQRQATSDHHGNDTFPSYCSWLDRLQAGHQQVLAHMDPMGNSSSQPSRSEIVLELCRPLLDRLRFHFVDESDRITSSRIDRLPEWLFAYIREHVFESEGPWDLVLHGIAPVLAAVETNSTTLSHAQILPAEFRNEVVGLAKWVLLEHNFFRNDLVAGPNSVPLTLCRAIEQVLSFDAYTMDLLPSLHGEEAVGLADFFIASDEELWQWWLERERGSVLSTLFGIPIVAEESSSSQRRTDLLLSPRAELFCALIHSIQCKAQVFSSSASSVYLGQVAVPLCMQFLDAIHLSATDLRNLLSRGRGIPLDLGKNVQSWMEVINGTHLASAVLTATKNDKHPQPGDDTDIDNDMARVGRSLERLRDALVEEFGTSLVETVLMERAKLASYLMRCPHLLSSAATTDVVSDETSLSPDLHDVASVLSKVMDVCNDHIVVTSDCDGDAAPDKAQAVLGFAPQAIRSCVANRVADKFLEIALDSHGMTPDLLLGGAKIFARDVTLIGDVFGHNPAFLRLLDVTKFMTMSSEWLDSLRHALLGLVQYEDEPAEHQRILLTFQHFSGDDTLFDEALSMIRAKGFAWLELEDATSILNRRTDSFL